MRWFGGHIGGIGASPRPTGTRILTTRPTIWAAGFSVEHDVRLVGRGNSEVVAVIGPCSATDAEVASLIRDLREPALVAWSGAYTIVHRASDGRVVIMTDPAGASPIYTTRGPNGALMWASSSRVLAGLAVSDVDESWLAATLVDPLASAPGRSAWTDVAMLPPGHRLAVSVDGRATLRPAWRPSHLDRDQAVQRLRGALTSAVACRVRGVEAAADLSGGLDSSTLAVLAAQQGRVTAVTVHPEGVDSGGDLDYARLTASGSPTMRHSLLPLRDLDLPFSGMTELPPTDEPAPSTTTWRRQATQLKMLAATGIRCQLTGDGGDTMFAPPPVYLSDLARSGRCFRLAAEAQAWARLQRMSPWPLLAAAIRGDVAQLAGRAGGAGITPKALELAVTVGTADASVGLSLADHAMLADVRHVARTAHAESQLADGFGITLHNPYLDARILDTVLAVPARSRVSPRRYKPLLSDATAGLFPERVRLRAAKGVFAEDHHRGVRANLRSLLAMADGHLVGRRLVDMRWLHDQLHRAALGIDVRWSQLAPVLGAEVWLRTMADTSPVRWTYEQQQAVVVS